MQAMVSGFLDEVHTSISMYIHLKFTDIMRQNLIRDMQIKFLLDWQCKLLFTDDSFKYRTCLFRVPVRFWLVLQGTWMWQYAVFACSTAVEYFHKLTSMREFYGSRWVVSTSHNITRVDNLWCCSFSPDTYSKPFSAAWSLSLDIIVILKPRADLSVFAHRNSVRKYDCGLTIMKNHWCATNTVQNPEYWVEWGC